MAHTNSKDADLSIKKALQFGPDALLRVVLADGSVTELTAIELANAVQGQVGAILLTELGHSNVFVNGDGELRQLTYAQDGDFAAPAVAGKRFVEADGPDEIYPAAMLRYRERLASDSPTLHLLVTMGQSNGAGATGYSGAATKQITAQNTFTKRLRAHGTAGVDRAFTITVDFVGGAVGTVVLQRELDDGSYENVAGKSWTADASESYDDGLEGEVWYRIGVPTGGYTSGTITVTIGYAEPESGAITLLPPLSGKALMFVGGISPLQGGVDSTNKNTIVADAQLASIVDAYSGANPAVDRETQAMGQLLVIASHLPEGDKAIAVNFSIGSTEFSESIYGFGTAWAANTAYTVNQLRRPTALNGFRYRVSSISGTGTSGASEPTWPTTIGLTVTDNPGANQVVWECYSEETKPAPLLNVEKAAAAAVAYAQANDMTVRLAVTYNGNESNADIISTVAWRLNLERIRDRCDELEVITGQADPGKIVLALTTYPRYNILHDPASNLIDPWVANAAHVMGDFVVPTVTPTAFQYEATAIAGGGLSGASEPTWPVVVGNTVVDNQVTWTCRALTPDVSKMGLTSNVTLGSFEYALEDDANCGCYVQYDLLSDEAVGTGHWSPPVQHLFGGEKAGWTLLSMLAGDDDNRLPLYVVSAEREISSTIVRATLSKAATLDETLVTDPGAYGFSYDNEDGDVPFRDPPLATFSQDGTELELTLAADPTGEDETLNVACDNGTVFEDYSVATYPYTAGTYGNGAKVGSRSNLRTQAQVGYSLWSGRPFYEYAAARRVPVNVYADQPYLKEAAEAIFGAVPALCIDFNDPRCWDGVGQTVTDLADTPHNYYRGTTNGAEATDPTRVEIVNGQRTIAYARFDGGDCLVPAAGYTTFDNVHKADAKFTFGAVYWCPATVSDPQYMLANLRDLSSSKLGFQFRLNASGQPGIVIPNSTGNATMLGVNLGGDIVLGQWAFAMISVDAEAGVGWGTSTGLDGAVTEFAVNYAAAGSGDPDSSGPAIGKTGTADLSPEYLMNLFRMGWIFGYVDYFQPYQGLALRNTAGRWFPGA